MFRTLIMRVAQTKMMNFQKIRLINTLIFNKAKVSLRHPKNIQIWQKM